MKLSYFNVFDLLALGRIWKKQLILDFDKPRIYAIVCKITTERLVRVYKLLGKQKENGIIKIYQYKWRWERRGKEQSRQNK